MVHLSFQKVEEIATILHNYYDEYIHLYNKTRNGIYKKISQDIFQMYLDISTYLIPNELPD